ncbi:transmembrane protein 127-like [Biomphalaria glabrata]|uniref:Transmembrane protein 127-like n=1 Tax=Biomphalaria glabrata TaxID=6526 RepID=A0A9W3B2R3_BIOGL|nr:transmembrane protein 127-like [Biomphalaria glabrata]XP_055893705.1 transmembrane protein 127-like [Biomphalaria glabrata]XP_055893717.1 transmembrane protein 127-like [Biomphalaria glabrata]
MTGPLLNSDLLFSQQLSQPLTDPGSSHTERPSGTPRASANRSRSSRRSHRSRSSSSRNRNRHRHYNRHHDRYGTRVHFKQKERNFLSASCSMIAIVLLCTSLEPDWIFLTGGGCHLLSAPVGSMKQLSTSQFFYNGHFYKNYPNTDISDVVYKFGPFSNDIMVNCVTYPTVLLFKTTIAFVFVAVLCSLTGFLLDLIGPNYQLLKLLRRNAIFNILTVILCVTINLFIYWITTAIEKLQTMSRLHEGSKIQVTFDVSFYLVTAAGGMSVLATAFNCLHRQTENETSESSRGSDYLYFDDTQVLLPPVTPTADLAPPPAYTP